MLNNHLPEVKPALAISKFYPQNEDEMEAEAKAALRAAYPNASEAEIEDRMAAEATEPDDEPSPAALDVIRRSREAEDAATKATIRAEFPGASKTEIEETYERRGWDAFGEFLRKRERDRRRRKLETRLKRSGTKSRFMDEDEMEALPDPEWLVPDVIQVGSTVLLDGAWGTFKSFLALDLALGIATGHETFGVKPTRVGPVFYGVLEGKIGIAKVRRQAWRIAHQIEGKIDNFYVGTAPLVSDENDIQDFGNQIVTRCDGSQPALVVIDTLAKSMGGLKENDAGDAGRFIKFCDSLRDELGCAVLAIHHLGKDEGRGARGSSAFEAGFDTILEVTAKREAKTAEVWVKKQKDAAERETPFTLQGKPVGQALVFYPTSADEHRKLTQENDLATRQVVGATLVARQCYGHDRGVTTSVLTEMLIPERPDVAGEETERLRHNLGKLLQRRAKIQAGHLSLEAYAYPGTAKRDPILWYLPEPSSISAKE